MSKKKLSFSIIISAVIFVMVCAAWYAMFTRAKGETFAQRGFSNLKYFTVDSNLLMAAAALVYIVFAGSVLFGKRNNIPEWAEIFYYIAVTAVSLTFSMVMVYLGPAFGYGSMFGHANLYFHLIVPVLSILSLCLLHNGHKITLKDSFLSLIPLLLYGVYYLGMIIRFGLDRPRTDWYWLAVGGEKMIPLVFLLIILGTWGISLLLRLAVNASFSSGKKN